MPTGDRVVQALDEIQAQHGFLARAELRDLASRSHGVTLHRLNEVASLFPHRRVEPARGLEVRVCRDMACHLAGARASTEGLKALGEELGPGKVAVDGVSCLGRCDGAPVVRVGDRFLQGGSTGTVRSAIAEAMTSREEPHQPPRRVSPPGPTGWRIDPSEGREDYAALLTFDADPDVRVWIEALKESEIRGMGGAGVFVHQKWSDVRQARGDLKYVVVNGDESEPATFKVREILLRAPKLVLEGAILAGLAVGATRGFMVHPGEASARLKMGGHADSMGSCVQLGPVRLAVKLDLEHAAGRNRPRS